MPKTNSYGVVGWCRRSFQLEVWLLLGVALVWFAYGLVAVWRHEWIGVLLLLVHLPCIAVCCYLLGWHDAGWHWKAKAEAKQVVDNDCS